MWNEIWFILCTEVFSFGENISHLELTCLSTIQSYRQKFRPDSSDLEEENATIMKVPC